MKLEKDKISRCQVLLFTFLFSMGTIGCSNNSVKLKVFNTKNAVYCNTIKSFIIIKYSPITIKCNNNKKFASEAIGFTLSGQDTIRVLSICSYNKELMTTFSQLDLEVGFKNFRDSSVLKDTIYINGIEDFSSRRLKTVFADIFVFKE